MPAPPASTRDLKLIYTADGAAQLVRGDSVLWDSMDDLDFRDEFGEEILDPENDEEIDEVLDYLIDQGMISSAQADTIEIYREGEGETLEGELE